MNHDATIARIADLLRTEPLLADASAAFVTDLARQCKVTGPAVGEVIVEKDAPLEACVFIAGGHVELVQNLFENQQMTIDRLREGASFGKACFYAETVSEYTYVAGRDATLVILDKADLETVLSRFPEEAEKFQRYGRVQPIFARISKLALFSSLSTDRMWDLAGNLVRKKVAAGDVIIREGDRGIFSILLKRAVSRFTGKRTRSR